jgi:hypothetical protein
LPIQEYNTKLQRKLNRKSEGASILICPVDFVREPTIAFIRLENAIELEGLLEIKLYSRFIVLLIGPEESEKQLLQVGRAVATILTDDICREFAYVAKDKPGVMQMMDRFMQDTYVIPPSEWDPSIRIEPPPKYLSKVRRTSFVDSSLNFAMISFRNNVKRTHPNSKETKWKKSISLHMKIQISGHQKRECCFGRCSPDDHHSRR